MLKLHQVSVTPEWWRKLERFPDRLTSQTAEWMRFIAETQHASPVYAEVRDGSSIVGCFHGLVIRPLGVKILGSPFPGWTTEYMGFNLVEKVPRWMALQALERFAFNDLGCVYFEVADRRFVSEDGKRAGLEQRLSQSYENDLTETEQDLFAGLVRDYRRQVRKAARCEVIIEEAAGDDDFAHEYYEQLKDVFRKRGLIPTYSLETVRIFLQRLYPTGHLLLLRARNDDGRCIATGISHGINTFAQLWGCASFRDSLHLCPNQALHWHALKLWRSRGATTFDWGGGGKYKEQYGCRPVTIVRLCKSRVPLLSNLRDQAQSAVRQQFRLLGWWNSTLQKTNIARVGGSE